MAAALLDCARFRIESGWIVVNHVCARVHADNGVRVDSAKSGSGLYLSGCKWLIYFMIFYIFGNKLPLTSFISVESSGCMRCINLDK